MQLTKCASPALNVAPAPARRNVARALPSAAPGLARLQRTFLSPCPSNACSSSPLPLRSSTISRASPEDNGQEEPVKYNTEFGYSRKDVLLIGVGLIAGGYILYYGLQYAGMDASMAGNYVQLIIFMGICVGWIGSYLYRVATKQMTYAVQLDEYEEAVMQKRLDEMPEATLEALMEVVEKEKAAKKGAE